MTTQPTVAGTSGVLSESIRRGLADSLAGRVHDLGSFKEWLPIGVLVAEALEEHTYVIDGPPSVIGVRCACGFRDYPEFQTPEGADLAARLHVGEAVERILTARDAATEARVRAEVAAAQIDFGADREIEHNLGCAGEAECPRCVLLDLVTIARGDA